MKNIDDKIMGLFNFFVILFISVLLQAIVIAMATSGNKVIVVYDFINYSLFGWIMQILYWCMSLCTAIIVARS